jgi:hypothetical protein
MTNAKPTLANKEIRRLALIGLAIIGLLAAGFAGIGLTEGPGWGIALYSLWWLVYPLTISLYVGYFAGKVAKGRWRFFWLWGVAGFLLTLISIKNLPQLLVPVFSYRSVIIFPFIAPVLSAVLILSIIGIRKGDLHS